MNSKYSYSNKQLGYWIALWISVYQGKDPSLVSLLHHSTYNITDFDGNILFYCNRNKYSKQITYYISQSRGIFISIRMNSLKKEKNEQPLYLFYNVLYFAFKHICYVIS